VIDEYLRAIEDAIAVLGRIVRSSNIYKDEREAEIIFLRGEIRFADDSYLHFREFVQLKQGQPPNRYKYAFHHQRADETILFRYDNARHYPDLPTAPHHKHIGEEDVIASNPSDLQFVLKEIEALIG